MKKWIVCRYGTHHIQAPHECTPIGVAYQTTASDDPADLGFVDLNRFEAWLKSKDLCAFHDGYKKALGVDALNIALPVVYDG